MSIIGPLREKRKGFFDGNFESRGEFSGGRVKQKRRGF
jgi:hypothetical protein